MVKNLRAMQDMQAGQESNSTAGGLGSAGSLTHVPLLWVSAKHNLEHISGVLMPESLPARP